MQMRVLCSIVFSATLLFPAAMSAQGRQGQLTFSDGGTASGVITTRTGFHTGTDGMRYQKEGSDYLIFLASGSDATVKIPLSAIKRVDLTYEDRSSPPGVVYRKRQAKITLHTGKVLDGTLPASGSGADTREDFTTHLLVQKDDYSIRAYQLQYFISQFFPPQSAEEQVSRIVFQ
jgi:hypothetical protein